MQYLIYLSGMPGTGKTTLSDKIVGIMKHSVLIRRNSIKEWIGDFGGNKILSDIIKEDELIYEIMASATSIALKKKYDVVIDGAGWRRMYYDKFEKLANKQGVKMISIRLKCELSESEHRTTNRKLEYRWNRTKLSNYKKMFEKIPIDLLLNTDINNPDKCLEKVMKNINI